MGYRTSNRLGRTTTERARRKVREGMEETTRTLAQETDIRMRTMKTILISLLGGALLLVVAGVVVYITLIVQPSAILSGGFCWLVCSFLFYVLRSEWKDSRHG